MTEAMRESIPAPYDALGEPFATLVNVAVEPGGSPFC